MPIIRNRRPFSTKTGSLTPYKTFDHARNIATYAKQTEEACLNYTRVARDTKRVAKSIHLLVQQLSSQTNKTKQEIFKNKINNLIKEKLNPLLSKGEELFEKLQNIPIPTECPTVTIKEKSPR